MMMDNASLSRPSTERQRLIEGWLPLAQEANQRYGWDLDAPALESLIMSAATALERAGSTVASYAILWFAYQRLRHDG
ncbi:hypothetical protein K2Z83_24020 [Oscillochloris sp. ZM17-4]|uniref:hypothetical protein n=1 Tax=Oscillochloris sp. ZM17-4 TaxID=2866714 RepID=UPI001C731C0E|nr:hypothetical protein [Oscillochloris sp. ZM17-4]MBX0330729.1 hypothetical protein [Oscillochloris sp. ZM17-4]